LLLTEQSKEGLQDKLDVPTVGLFPGAQCHFILPYLHQVKSCTREIIKVNLSQQFLSYMIMKALTAVNVKDTWDVMPFVNLLKRYKYFGETATSIFRIVLFIQRQIHEHSNCINLILTDAPLCTIIPVASFKPLPWLHNSLETRLFGFPLDAEQLTTNFSRSILLIYQTK
jgi:hypothetical protein